MARHRTIDVRKQRNLTFRETVDLCLRGVSERMLRSVLTLAVVSLAVAFFMFLLAENQLTAAVAVRTGRESARQRSAVRMLAWAYRVPTSVVNAQRMATAWRRQKDSLNQFARVCGWSAERTKQLAEFAAEEAAYLAFFGSMPSGKRAVLVKKLKGRAILRSLVDESAREQFAIAIAPLHDLRLPGGMGGFSTFLDGYIDYEKELVAFTRAWASQLAHLAEATSKITGGVPVEEWLVSCDDESLRGWGELIRETGFNLDDETLSTVKKQVEASALRRAIAFELQTSEKREAWRVAFRERKWVSVDEKITRLGDERAASVLAESFTPEQLNQTAEAEAFANHIDRLEKKLLGHVAEGSEPGKLSGRQAFLLGISFVVCMVGITNAMLMSITERFREIATMKCLGATDRFILVQFMTEAGLQGLFGGLIGMVIGFTVALIKNVTSFGWYAMGDWPTAGLFAAGVFSMGAGVVLSVLASMYPAWSASRMAPMDAMRVE